MRAISFPFFCALLGASALTQIASAQDFVVRTIDGDQPAAPLARIGADWSVRVAGSAPRLYAGGDVVSIRRADGGLPDWPKRNFLLLTSGERIPFNPAGPFLLEDDRLIFRIDASVQSKRSGTIRVPLAYVAGLVLSVPDGEDDADLFLARLHTAKRSADVRSADVLLLKNGDRVEGKLKDISTDHGFWFDVDGRKVETPLAASSVLLTSGDLQSRLRTKKTHAQVVLAGGGRLLLSDAGLDADGGLLTGKALAGFDVSVPLDKVLSIDMRGGRAVYLSDLVPKSYEHRPYLGLSWPLAHDRAVSGRPLRLAARAETRTFDKGLGMHAPSQATYALDGSFRWFEAAVGIDAKAGARGQARISVLVDGKEAESASKKEIIAAGQPLDLRIDIRKARTLTLRVDLGDFGDVQAHVDWADARLIRD